jgi:hypothetical protein
MSELKDFSFRRVLLPFKSSEWMGGAEQVIFCGAPHHKPHKRLLCMQMSLSSSGWISDWHAFRADYFIAAVAIKTAKVARNQSILKGAWCQSQKFCFTSANELIYRRIPLSQAIRHERYKKKTRHCRENTRSLCLSLAGAHYAITISDSKCLIH